MTKAPLITNEVSHQSVVKLSEEVTGMVDVLVVGVNLVADVQNAVNLLQVFQDVVPRVLLTKQKSP